MYFARSIFLFQIAWYVVHLKMFIVLAGRLQVFWRFENAQNEIHLSGTSLAFAQGTEACEMFLIESCVADEIISDEECDLKVESPEASMSVRSGAKRRNERKGHPNIIRNLIAPAHTKFALGAFATKPYCLN